MLPFLGRGSNAACINRVAHHDSNRIENSVFEIFTAQSAFHIYLKSVRPQSRVRVNQHVNGPPRYRVNGLRMIYDPYADAEHS